MQIFTEQEAFFALMNLVLWADEHSSEKEEAVLRKLVQEEKIPEHVVLSFNEKWNAMASEEEVYKISIRSLRPKAYNTRVKVVGWMYDIANEGGEGNRSPEETVIINRVVSSLAVEREDAVDYYRSNIPRNDGGYGKKQDKVSF